MTSSKQVVCLESEIIDSILHQTAQLCTGGCRHRRWGCVQRYHVRRVVSHQYSSVLGGVVSTACRLDGWEERNVWNSIPTQISLCDNTQYSANMHVDSLYQRWKKHANDALWQYKLGCPGSTHTKCDDHRTGVSQQDNLNIKPVDSSRDYRCGGNRYIWYNKQSNKTVMISAHAY